MTTEPGRVATVGILARHESQRLEPAGYLSGSNRPRRWPTECVFRPVGRYGCERLRMQ